MADLIHCITNPISMMMCANAVLSLGAKPIMAEHPLEVKEITETAQALLLNLGNISDSRMEAMQISFDTAMGKEIPIVLDVVGIACSGLRRRFVLELLERYEKGILLIKGNYSEILALSDMEYRGIGVDAQEGLEVEAVLEAASELAIKYNAVVLASGARDIVTDGRDSYLVDNGDPELGMVTGTGCMLGAICARFLASEGTDRSKCIEAVVRACAFLGMSGEIACENAGGKGQGSFLIALFDAISLLDKETVDKRIRFEKV